jgi:hypothetical protein
MQHPESTVESRTALYLDRFIRWARGYMDWRQVLALRVNLIRAAPENYRTPEIRDKELNEMADLQRRGNRFRSHLVRASRPLAARLVDLGHDGGPILRIAHQADRFGEGLKGVLQVWQEDGAKLEAIVTDLRRRADNAFDAVHSADFREVRWFGEHYTFTDQQSQCVKALWQEWEKGGLGLGDAALGEAAGSSSDRFRLVHTFRGHPAWRTMIQRRTAGVHYLTGPLPTKTTT